MSTISVLESLLGIIRKYKPIRSAHVLTNPTHSTQERGGKQAVISTTAATPHSPAMLRKQNPLCFDNYLLYGEKNDYFTVQTKNSVCLVFFLTH